MVYKSSTITSAGGGSVTEITPGTGLDSTPNPITATGTIFVADGTPDSLAGYDATGEFSGVTVGTGLDLTAGTLTATGSGAVSSVSNSDGSLTISPTTGDVVASLAVGHANTWTGQQTFNTSAIILGTTTASTALVTDGSKNVVSSSTTATELGYVHGVTSAIQTQIDGKQASGNYITALTGDGTASGPGSAAFTLATVNSNVGSFGAADKTLTATANGKGLVTAIAETSIQITESQVTDLTTDLAAKAPLASPTFTGTVTLPAGQVVNGVTLTTAGSSGDYLGADGTYHTIPTGGSVAFSDITGATNTTAAMVVGTGASLATSGSGTITATAAPLSGISGLGTGVATALAVNTGSSGAFVINGGALGTPSSGVATNLTGTASGLTAGTVTTNANLTGPITSSGNATSVASQTGTGTKFVMDTSPTLVTPNIGVATGTSLDASGVLESGANGGTGGQLKMFGATSGDVTLKVAAAAGTGTVFQLPADNGTNNYVLSTNGSGVTSWAAPTSGTVTSVSVASANGFAGSSSGGATPALTLSTSVTGVLKGNGTAISAATAGTDYSAGTSSLATGILKSTTSTGALSIAIASDFPTLNQNTTGSAATLTTPRAIYGNNFDGSAALTQIIASTYGGTGNGFTKFSGPATSEKTFTLPNASATILTTNAVVTGAQGGTGVNNSGKTITLGGNFTTSGAFATTLTVTAGTNVTLPTTGTLATLAGSESLTNKDLTSGTNTFPTFNQNTTGSAAKWTTARNLAGNSVDGSANVAFANKFIVQGTTDSGLSGAQFLGALGTGLVKNTTTTGVLSIATSGTDYAPATSGSSILYGNGAGGFSNVTVGSGLDFTAGTLSSTATGTIGGSTGATDNAILRADGTGGSTLQSSGATIDDSGNITATSLIGLVQTYSTANSSNLVVQNTTGAATTSQAEYQLLSSSAMQYRVGMRGSSASTVGAGRSYAGLIIGTQGVTEASSGTHPLFAQAAIRAPSYTNAAGATDYAATLYIEGPQSGITPASGDYATWIDAGELRVDGDIGDTTNRVNKLWATDAEFTNAPTIGGTSATGTGGLVRATSPTLVTPTLGAAAATSINFGGTSLSVYQEGTFTPTVTGSSTAGTGTYGTQVGYYTVTGNRLSFDIYLSWTAHTGTGNLQVSNLPFTPTSYSALNVYYSGLTTAANTQLCAYTNSGTTNIVLYRCASASASVAVAMDTFVNELMISGTCRI